MLHTIRMITRNLCLLSIIALCQVSCSRSQSVGTTDSQFKSVTINGNSITDGPTVLKAIRMLEKIYSVPISYEDTRYVNESLLVDITEQVQRTPDPSHRIMGLKARTFSFTYKLPPSGQFMVGSWLQTRPEREEEVAAALKSVLEGYAASGGPESFTVVNENGVFRVSATNFLNIDGKLEQITPILDTKITISPGQRNSTVLLNEICQELSKAAGVNVGISNLPYNGGSGPLQTVTTISGSGVTARSLLSRLLNEMDAQMSSVAHQSWTTAWIIEVGADLHYSMSFHHMTLNDN